MWQHTTRDRNRDRLKRCLALAFCLISLPAAAGEPDADRQLVLRNLLKGECGACHGLTLKGGMGPSLLPEALEGKSDEFLADTILNGREGTPMPPWNTFMTRNEANWLVSVLRNPER